MKRYMLSYRADAHSVRFAKFQEDNKGAHLVKHADIHLKGTYVEAGHINAVPSCDTAMIPAIPMQQTPPYLQVTLALYGGACLPAAALIQSPFPLLLLPHLLLQFGRKPHCLCMLSRMLSLGLLHSFGFACLFGCFCTLQLLTLLLVHESFPLLLLLS